VPFKGYENPVIIYSPSCVSKPVYCTCLSSAQDECIHFEKYLNVYCPYEKSKYGPIQHLFFGLTLTETGQDLVPRMLCMGLD